MDKTPDVAHSPNPGPTDKGQGKGHENDPNNWRHHKGLLAALALLIALQVAQWGFGADTSALPFLAIYLLAYYLAGKEVLYMAFRKAMRLDFFNEFFLMSVATIGAFILGAYSEGVAVMIFYAIGEWFQDLAVHKARRNIKSLLDMRPDIVNRLQDGALYAIRPQDVAIGDIIEVKPGEKVALDGTLITEKASFNTSALTGESKPDNKYMGEQVLAGMVNLNTLARIRVDTLFYDSKLSRILHLVQNASSQKSKTQKFLSKFARIYTPAVFALALAIVVLPAFFSTEYVFKDWLYRGLVFLVISCPCALVISVPLGYFGGIGLASKNGILFKGGNFLDVMSQVRMVVLDKTGTLTEGVFAVQKLEAHIEENAFLSLAATIESASSHPIAQAITAYAEKKGAERSGAEQVEEIPGMGLKARIDGKTILAGNLRLLDRFGIPYPQALGRIVETIVALAQDGTYIGYFGLGDAIKDDAHMAISELKASGIRTMMLSGDKSAIVNQVATELGIDEAYGDLMPEDKVQKLKEARERHRPLAFVGDGVNDAPVLALADVGIAMGGLGSDAAIESADMVIQTDQPSKIMSAIRVGKITKRIVWQNILLAMVVKLLFMVLGAEGHASLWEAVIADVGVALLAILNAVRIQYKNLK